MSEMNDFLVELIAKLDTSQAITDVNTLQKELEKKNINLKTVLNTTTNKQELQNFAVEIQKIFNQKGYDIDISKILSSLNQVSNQAQTVAKKIHDIQFGLDTEKYSSQIASITTQLSKFSSLSGKSFTETKESANNLTGAYERMKSAMADSSLADSTKLKSEKDYQKALAKTQNL